MHRFEDLPASPDEELLSGLVEMLASVKTEMNWTVVMLLSRPGGPEDEPCDRAWAGTLLREADRVKLPMWPIFAANDHSVYPAEPLRAA